MRAFSVAASLVLVLASANAESPMSSPDFGGPSEESYPGFHGPLSPFSGDIEGSDSHFKHGQSYEHVESGDWHPGSGLEEHEGWGWKPKGWKKETHGWKPQGWKKETHGWKPQGWKKPEVHGWKKETHGWKPKETHGWKPQGWKKPEVHGWKPGHGHDEHQGWGWKKETHGWMPGHGHDEDHGWGWKKETHGWKPSHGHEQQGWGWKPSHGYHHESHGWKHHSPPSDFSGGFKGPLANLFG